MHRISVSMRIAISCSLLAIGFNLSCSTPDQKPNFILILVDDLGWTDLGSYGSDLYQTPNIDALAQSGLRFTNAYAACTVCSPTRASVMTGKYPARLHITDWIHGHERPHARLRPPEWTHYLPLAETTLAEALRETGYATAHIGKWHLGEEHHWPDKQGFDHNLGGYHRGQPPSYFSPYRIPSLADGPKGEYLTDREADEAIKFISENKDQPFFLYLPHYAVHTPLQAKASDMTQIQLRIQPEMRHRHATYAAMVESVDQALGKIRAELDRLDIASKTWIIFTSDNGGLSHRGERKLDITDNFPLRSGKGSAYEGGVRVPLIVAGPDIALPGRDVNGVAISPDYFPTILELAGVQSDATELDGESLTSVFRGVDAQEGRDLFWHYPHYHPGGANPYSAVRSGDWKLIHFFDTGEDELYDLGEDIGESENLVASQPEKVGELKQKLADWYAKVGAQMPVKNPEFDAGLDAKKPWRR